jgi:hypothetical protein
VPVAAVTFSAPRVGNRAFCEGLASRGVRVLRVVVRHDVVPLVPPFSPKEFILSLLEELLPAVGVDSLIETEKTGRALLEEFHGYVSGKRCLIVLNDLSTIEEWIRVRKCFPISKEGNRIIVSTTNVEVASLCVGQNSVVSELKQLSADQTIYAFYKEVLLNF